MIISSDTAVAHLAGALNKEVWIPLQKFPDWRWTNKGETLQNGIQVQNYLDKNSKSLGWVFQSINAKLSKNIK